MTVQLTDKSSHAPYSRDRMIRIAFKFAAGSCTADRNSLAVLDSVSNYLLDHTFQSQIFCLGPNRYLVLSAFSQLVLVLNLQLGFLSCHLDLVAPWLAPSYMYAP